jgi:pimeloyl-ACP methyl ester carboxylesterase
LSAFARIALVARQSIIRRNFAAAAPGAKLVVLPGFGHMLHHAATDNVFSGG